MSENSILGVDIGGSGIKGAIVDIESGKLLSDRIKLLTPQPSTPSAVAKTVIELVELIGWEGKSIGCGFPATMKNGVAKTAANVHKDWINTNAEELFSEATGKEVKVINDADAAGLAELKFGHAKGKKGTVILITIGSGLGSALFTDGHLVPNTEFGHIFLHGGIAEHYAANSARKRLELSWEEWGGRFKEYLQYLERVLTPDLIILGGGVSKKFKNYAPYLNVETPTIPAAYQNNAGIIGAAVYAHS